MATLKNQCFIDTSIIFSDEQKEALLVHGLEISHFDPLHSSLKGINYLLLHSKLSDEHLVQLTNCSYIGIRAHNLDYVNSILAKEMGIVVCGLRNQHGINAVAEHAFALIFALAKHLLPAHHNVLAGQWRAGLGSNMELRGKRLGIVGNGQIGQRVGGIGRVLGMEVMIAGRPNLLKAGELPLEQVLAQADVVSLHLSSKRENDNFINHERLAMMKKGVILINTARGSVLDYNALTDALNNGRLLGAGLDVFPEEPFLNERFSDFPNVILTPHVGFLTTECLNHMNQELILNLLNVVVS